MKSASSTKGTAELRVVRAAMGWLRWMEKVQRAELWLKEKPFGRDSQIPKLLRACDALRKTRRKK